MDIDRAMAFVQRHGNVVDRSRLASLLFDRPPGPYSLRELGNQQRPDGGFSPGQPACSTVASTARALYYCDDMQVHDGSLVQAACLFLLQRRCLDGGWDEVDAVRTISPPSWLMPGRLETRLWLSGCCAHVLSLMGFAPTSTNHSPSHFVLSFQDASGLIGGDLLTTWVALPSLARHPGSDSAEFRRALAACDDLYDGHEAPAFSAWMLRCLRDAAVPLHHPLVKRALGNLAWAQRTDGGWDSAAGNGNGASATLQVLRAFHSYGLLRRGAAALPEASLALHPVDWQSADLSAFFGAPLTGTPGAGRGAYALN